MAYKEQGFSYIEVVVSLAVLMLVVPMGYQGLQLGQKVQQRAHHLQEVTTQSEGIMAHVATAVKEKSLPVADHEDLIDYIATPIYTKEWLEEVYKVKDYDYYLAMMPLGPQKQGKHLTEETIARSLYLSTQPQEASHIISELVAQGDFALEQIIHEVAKPLGGIPLEVQIHSLEPLRDTIITSRVKVLSIPITLKRDTTQADTLTYRVTDTTSVETIEDKQTYKKRHTRYPVVLRLAAQEVEHLPQRIVIQNESSFPVAVQVVATTDTPSLQVQVKTSDTRGHVSCELMTEKQERMMLCLLAVTQKGEQTPLKKQMMVIPY